MYNAKAPKVHLTDKHITFQLLPDLKEICRPFFKKTGIQHFHYLHYNLTEEKIIAITTAPEANRHVFENQFIASGKELETGIHYLPLFKAGNERAEIGKRYNVDNIIEFIDNKGEGVVEMFGFATHCGQPEMVNFYFDHLEQLNRFNVEFKMQAASMLEQAFADPIHVPGYNKGLTVANQKLLQKKNYGITGRKISLSQRELDVLQGLAAGLTAKESARNLGLSHRTIEYYLQNIKNKIGCTKSTELLNICYINQLL